jgi:NADH:ubiquinone oxidoreductase subunit E
MANNSEIGSTGLVEFSGRILADFLRELRGIEAFKRFEEMRLNSAVIGSLLLAIRNPILAMEWQPASEREGDPRLEILEAAIENMSYSWKDHVGEALLFLPFGYYPFEIVYERIDGKLLWRKFSPRGQDTIIRWSFSDDGGITGFYQRVRFTEEKFIPIEKTILYRINVERNNPEGRSILRTAWTSYYYAKYISQSEAIGIERGMDGFPIITLPEGASTDTDDADSDASKAAEFVRNIRNDEQAGMVLPFGWALELFAPGAQSRLDADKVIRRYESRMLMSALAQFLNLGQESVGSLALSKDQTDFFAQSLNATADVISDTVTKYAIPRLMKLNGYDADGLSLTHTPATQEDIVQISTFLQQVGSFLNWSADDEVWLRQVARLPERSIEDIKADMKDRQAARDAAVAALKRASEKKQAEEEESKDELIARFAANPPDEAKRRRIERQMQKAMAEFLTKQKRRILKSAREYRP